MKIPYSVLQPCGKVLFAAKGGKIHSFGVDEGTYLSTWKHPDVGKVAEAINSQKAVESQPAVAETEEANEPQSQDEGPPAKRQKMAEPKGDSGMEVDEPEPAEPVADGKSKGGFKHWKQRKEEKKNSPQNAKKKSRSRRAPEQPLITHLIVTSTGSHLVAVSGHDKIIWVFEHDGNGLLKQLTQRPMPKRPCAVLVSPDDTTILSADKFGDVYSLPLIPSETSEASASAHSTPTPAPQKPWKPEASNTTVHSRRNLESLRQQQIQAAKRDKEGQSKDAPEKPSFEHTLILGHVSLLTDMCLARKDGRTYILTADRDEHIRLSRYIPQAHIIEGFCLGHKNFVTAMAVPASRPELLISGGGDNELFVWDWLAGQTVSKFDLFSLVQKFSEEVTRIAVSHIFTTVALDAQGAETTAVLVICEGVPALFVLSLASSSSPDLTWTETIPFTGNPLHLATTSDADGRLQRILVATDAGDSGEGDAHVSALRYKAGDSTFETNYQLTDLGLSDDEAELTVEEVRRLVFGAEDLRKNPIDEAGAEDDDGEDALPEE